MIRNYFKIALRNLLHNKGYTAIKILGLAVGIMCCILIMLFVSSEWSFDKFHSNADRIYRVWQDEKYEDQNFVNTITPIIMGPTLEANIPEVEGMCRILRVNPTVTYTQKDFTDQALMVDTTFFKLFDFKLLEGNRANPFPQINTVILSKTTAKKYFGNASALGKNLEMQLGNEKEQFIVTGIIEDAPEPSSIQYNMLISYANVGKLFSEGLQKSWFNVFGETYVMLREGILPEQLYPKFPDMMKQALGENYEPGGFEVYLQPITEIHLDNNLPQGLQPISNPKYSYILATIGILILLVACANFVILAIGHSSSRAREVGVRKVMGAERHQLIYQFMGEAFIVTCASMILGIGFSLALLKPFNSIINRELAFPLNISFVIFCLLLVLIIAFISGFYPAIFLSKFNPVVVLKGKLSSKKGSGFLRQGLVIGQFAASIAMIICTIVIGQQIDYFKNKDLGYNKEQIIVVSTNLNRIEGAVLAERYRTELLKHPEVSEATVSLYSFAESPWITLGFTNEMKAYRSFQYNSVDANFIEAMDIEVKEGRAFNEQITSDVTNAAVVNEAFVELFGLKDPIGKKLPGPFQQEIIGVVKDFNFQSLHTPVSPLLMTMKPDSVFRKTENIGMAFAPQPRISVRMEAGGLSNNIKVLEEAWKQVAPNQDFVNTFLDASIEAQYKAEARTSTIVKIASGLSIFIATMGLFGLVTLILSRRKKEIGIRKVLGAKVISIIKLISMDFALLILIASILAFPLAWWFMNDWLQEFAYKVDIKWWVFVLASVAAIVIALITISVQTVKTALSNPVNSLRTE
ncbi:putative ABC transport system permease protein [Flavobacteriaceae bacterium MAR_2010_105]|nr:putative ABC transport system permease protein [Flavobacteriaceae bacterium MAR_2010_105]